jgi:hypothetical protein
VRLEVFGSTADVNAFNYTTKLFSNEALNSLRMRATIYSLRPRKVCSCPPWLCSRVAKRDLAFVTASGYRKLLAQIWRPKIGTRIFDDVRYSELAKIANIYQWSKKTYNNSISVIRSPTTTATRITQRNTIPLPA